ncbi:hypothetical protein BHE74_00019703 [Ensete ventricosum]|nr:hypothetical protein BHE74_00019703 [Ensete ventricosum]
MRIMIDTGSSTDILYLDAFHKLRMTNRDLVAMTSTLTGFIDDAIIPVGIVTLPVTFNDEPRTKTLMAREPNMACYLSKARPLISMTKYFKIFQISCLENAKVDALAWLASADAANELPTIPSLCQSTVAIVEMATTTTYPD